MRLFRICSIVSINSTSYKGSGCPNPDIVTDEQILGFPLIPLPIKEAVSVQSLYAMGVVGMCFH